MTSLLLLILALFLGMCAVGTTHAARALAPQAWLLHKPLSCDLCMSWWSSWLGVVLLGAGGTIGTGGAIGTIGMIRMIATTLAVVLASTGLSVLLLKAAWRLGE
jgi:hypothetical protein